MKSKEEFNQYEFEQIELVQSSEQKSSSSTGRVKYFFILTVPKMEKFRYGNFPLRNHICQKYLVDKTLVHVLTEICLRQTLNFRSLGVGKY